MSEKKKALLVLGIGTFLLIIVFIVIITTLMESNKRLEQIKDVMNSKEAKIVYLVKDSCYYCNLLEPITTSLEQEFDLDYYKIDTSKLSNSELSKILETLEIDINTFGTPYIAIVKDGKKIDEHVGYTDENVLFDLFKYNKIIGEKESLTMTYLDEIDSILNSSESSLVLIGASGDTNSIQARIILRKLAKNYSIDIKYFDTSKLTVEAEYSDLLSKLEIKELPVLVKLENGNVISKETEIKASKYETYLKENGYIE